MRGRLSRHLGGRSVARRRHGTATRPPELRGGRSVSWTTFRTPSPPRQGVLVTLGSVGSESAVTVTGRGEKTQLRGQRNEVCGWGGATRGCRRPDSAPDSAGPFRTPSRGLFAGRVFPEDPSPCWALQ